MCIRKTLGIVSALISIWIEISSNELSQQETDFPWVATASHIEGGGIGYSQGYSSLELLFAKAFRNLDYFFIDTRFHVFNNGRIAANAGIGSRFKTPFQKGVFGIYFYYDFRQARSSDFNQLGLGFEFLGPRFDFWINGYQPIGKKEELLKHTSFHNYPGGYYVEKSTYQITLRGADAELAFHFKNSPNMKITGAIGAYLLLGQPERNIEVIGGKARLQMIIHPYFTIEGLISHDDLFNTRAQGLISLSFPLSKPPKERKNFYPPPVVRAEIIPLSQESVWKWNY